MLLSDNDTLCHKGLMFEEIAEALWESERENQKKENGLQKRASSNAAANANPHAGDDPILEQFLGAQASLKDMMYYRTQFRCKAKPKCKPKAKPKRGEKNI